MKDNSLRTLGPQAARLVTTLHERAHPLFRLAEAREITGLSPASARSFVRMLVDRDVATRVRQGLFVLVPFEIGRERRYAADPLLVAREILRGKDYYLSHGTAMEIHGMLTQPRLEVTATTPGILRPVTAMGIRFRFVHCRRRDLFGLTRHWATKQEAVRVSDLERTVLDGLRQPRRCGGVTEVAKGMWMRREALDVPRLVAYALRLRAGAATRRLGYLLETYDLGMPRQRERLRRRLPAGYVPLDPLLPREGRRLKRWGLQLNVPLEELRAVAVAGT